MLFLQTLHQLSTGLQLKWIIITEITTKQNNIVAHRIFSWMHGKVFYTIIKGVEGNWLYSFYSTEKPLPSGLPINQTPVIKLPLQTASEICVFHWPLIITSLCSQDNKRAIYELKLQKHQQNYYDTADLTTNCDAENQDCLGIARQWWGKQQAIRWRGNSNDFFKGQAVGKLISWQEDFTCLV